MPRDTTEKPPKRLRSTNKQKRVGGKAASSKSKKKPDSLPKDYDPLANFVPKTDLAKRLWAIRLRIEAAGGANESVDEILERVRILKGYSSKSHR